MRAYCQSVICSLGNRLPWLGTIRRRFYAVKDVYGFARKSYSQHQEDLWFSEVLASLDKNVGMYVDVGGNHPTQLSNTYLLYRNGFRGLIVEPNRELSELFARFRPEDTVVSVGCGAEAALAKFKHASMPVLSTFSADVTDSVRNSKILRTEYVPIFPLDLICEAISGGPEWIYLLSIDTEGLDCEVLEGAAHALKRTLLLCVEANSEEERESILRLIEDRFVLEREFGCNCVFRNRKLGVRQGMVIPA